jgi:hypothetical protein
MNRVRHCNQPKAFFADREALVVIRDIGRKPVDFGSGSSG